MPLGLLSEIETAQNQVGVYYISAHPAGEIPAVGGDAFAPREGGRGSTHPGLESSGTFCHWPSLTKEPCIEFSCIEFPLPCWAAGDSLSIWNCDSFEVVTDWTTEE